MSWRSAKSGKNATYHQVQGLSMFMRPEVYEQAMTSHVAATEQHQDAARAVHGHAVRARKKRCTTLHVTNPKKQDEKPETVKTIHKMFEQAAVLEHALMCSYLYSAYSTKTRWEEFACVRVGDGNGSKEEDWVDNPRAAIQFEASREIQHNIVGVAMEEMLHLHFVNMLSRAVGSAPNFDLPNNGQFPITINDWVPDQDHPNESMTVRLDPLSKDSILNFVRFESTSNLGRMLAERDEPAFQTAIDLLKKTENVDLQCKAYFGLGIGGGNHPEVQRFLKFYKGELTPSTRDDTDFFAEACAEAGRCYQKSCKCESDDSRKVTLMKLCATKNTTFSSIGEFYAELLQKIQEAIDDGTLVPPDQTSDERTILQNLELLMLPMYRPGNLDKPHIAGAVEPEKLPYQTFQQIVDIIVDQGEGSNDFVELLTGIVDRKVWSDQAIKQLLQLTPSRYAMPGNITAWNAHLGIFARIFAKLTREDAIAKATDIPFQIAREPAENLPDRFQNKLVEQFNRLFLVMRVWLHRMYLVFETEQEDATNSAAIATVLAWGLMSQTIRPLIELMTFVPHDNRFTAFNNPKAKGKYTKDINLLVKILQSSETKAGKYSELEEADNAAYKLLKGISAWANKCAQEIQDSDKLTWRGAAPRYNPKELARGMIYRRLQGVAVCTAEIIEQIPFRQKYGNSDIPSIDNLPIKSDKSENLMFEQYNKNLKFNPNILPLQRDMIDEGNPTAIGVPRGVIYKAKQQVLRVTFSGWLINQLATDPDCNMSEIGYQGTFYARNTEAPFDRSYKLTSAKFKMFGEPNGTLYETPVRDLSPDDITPKPQVNLQEEATLYTLEEDFTGSQVTLDNIYEYRKPLPLQGSTQTVKVDKDCQIDLLTDENGRGPYNVGENHIIWTDGEPIDPFEFAVVKPKGDGKDGPEFETLLSRKVLYSGEMATNFSPQERAVAGRGPGFFLSFPLEKLVPDWAQDKRWKEQRNFFPLDRMPYLNSVVAKELEKDNPDATVIASHTERSKIVVDRGTSGTMYSWQQIYCTYAHCVSGKFGVVNEDSLKFVDGNFQVDQERQWITRYAFGSVDSDAGGLIHVFGETYIPVNTSCS